MREILFRGKRVDNGEWWYGLPLRTLNENGEDVLNIQCWERDEEGVTGIYEPVIPETVGQYTGLTDKNGKKIFEGDVVKIYLYEPKGLANYEIGYIKYDDAKARYVFCTEEGIYGIDNSNVFEVIGNIHDNPELLKGGEGVMACKWYAEFEGVCCYGDCPECADICPYEDKQNECEYYESEGADQ